MYAILLLSSLLVGPGTPPPAAAMPVVVQPLGTPEADFTALYNDVAALLRRALAETSDASALALLRSQTPALVKRQQQLRPAYNKWLASVPPAQSAAAMQRLQTSATTKSLKALENDPKVKARLAANEALAAAVGATMGAMNMTE